MTTQTSLGDTILDVTAVTTNMALLNGTLESFGNTTSDPISIARLIFESYTLTKVAIFMTSYHYWVWLAIGVPGNLASIYTILSMDTVTSSKTHVALLATADIIALILKVTFYEVSKAGLHITEGGCATIMFFLQFISDYVNWIVIAMTAERFVAVWFPLKVGRIYTRRKALFILMILALLTAGVSFVHFWAWTEHCTDIGCYCDIRPEFWDFYSVAFYWIQGLYSLIIPCICIMIGNTLIIWKVLGAKRMQRELTNSYDHDGKTNNIQRQITVMLVVVAIVFLTLNMPNAIFYVVKDSWKRSCEPYSYDYAKYYFTGRLVSVLLDANHAVNFFLYFLSMSTFRRRLMDAFHFPKSAGRYPGMTNMTRTSQTYIQNDGVTSSGRGEDIKPSSSRQVLYSAFEKRQDVENAKSQDVIPLKPTNRISASACKTGTTVV